LRDTTDEMVQASLQVVWDAVETQLKEVAQAIKKHMPGQSEMRANVELLTTIVGIGMVTTSKLLAEFEEIEHHVSAKAAAADAGLTPRQFQSGTSVRRRSRLSKQGKAGIRKALFLPAVTAIRHCPSMKAYAERLTVRGKSRMVVIGAVMRKLVHIIYGVLKHRTPYDPTKVLGPTPTST
jgi:transposase